MRSAGLLAFAAVLPALCFGAPPFVFRDVTRDTGLMPHVAGIAGHGVGWGDVDGDGWPELYVGTFGGTPYGSKSNQFFRNDHGKFQRDEQKLLQVTGRANGAVFVDFDNDGDLDLYITNHAIDGKSNSDFAEPNHLFRNDGGGTFVDVSADSGACPEGIAARSVATLDYDGDGLLDLVVGECFFQGGQSRTRIYRNLGGFKFENVSAAAGLPEKLTGFGVAAGDVTGDGWPDLFVSGRKHGNRLFVNDGRGRFREVPESHGNFEWKYSAGDDTSCGVCIQDVDRDGRADLLLGSHFKQPWAVGGIPVRLFLNRGIEGEFPKFEEATQAAGLAPLPMKSPHVEVQDFDNDGWPDLYTSIVKFGPQGEPHPLVFRGLGVKDGVPRFETGALDVNDFPSEGDRKEKNTGALFKRMLAEHKIFYAAPGPSGDFDRDGRLDLFLPSWWVEGESMLLKNETPGGGWLDVTVRGPDGVNRQGIGSAVRIYRAGQFGNAEALLGRREIAVGFGYASGQEAVAHFGLGEEKTCDVEVTLPHGKGRLVRKGVAAGQRIAFTDKTGE